MWGGIVLTHRCADSGPSGNAVTDRFNSRPLLVFWEMTKACQLACHHCRADAQREPGRDELSTLEAFAMIDALASVGRPRPILILTGGDCLMRSDIVEIAAYAHRQLVPVAIAPSVTPQLNGHVLDDLRSHGVTTASLSLDGADSQTHDDVRGVRGHFSATLDAIALLQHHGFTVQVNTTVMRSNLTQLADIAALMARHRVDAWEVFFLISTGRGTELKTTTPRENEDVCHFLVDASRYGFTVRTVEAPFFRRVAAQRRGVDHGVVADGSSLSPLRQRLRDLLGPPSLPVRAPSAATRDGKGIVFVASNGDVYPSGFLPLRRGNVRERDLIEIYRDDVLFREIRAGHFSGPCGSCAFGDSCGGSRSRAYAATGDPLASDPGCRVVELHNAARSLSAL